MRDFDLRKLQLIELDMLKDVAKFCDENEINYFLDSGTLLGAVRHKGFIPWDDDIDICMDIKNYKRFLKLAPKGLNEKYFVQNYKTDHKSSIRWTKVRINGTTSMEADMTNYDIHYGICMDIFAICGVSDFKLRRRIQNRASVWESTLLEKHVLAAKKCKLSKKLRLIYAAVPEIIRLFIIKLAEALAQIDPYKCQNCYNNFFMSSDAKEVQLYPSSLYREREKYLFEDTWFWGVKDAEKYLQITYGDWRKLPPENQREGHGDIIVDFENDYSRYYTGGSKH